MWMEKWGREFGIWKIGIFFSSYHFIHKVKEKGNFYLFIWFFSFEIMNSLNFVGFRRVIKKILQQIKKPKLITKIANKTHHTPGAIQLVFG